MNLDERTEQLIRKYPNETAQLRNDGVKSGLKHANPSEKTLQLIKGMEKEITQIKIEQGKQGSNIDHIKEKQEETHDMLKDFIKCSDDKFADKWVENAVKAVMGGVGLAVLGALMTLVLK